MRIGQKEITLFPKCKWCGKQAGGGDEHIWCAIEDLRKRIKKLEKKR